MKRRRSGGRGRELYSHSRLSQFENCPKKFEYRYVRKIPAESESVEGFLGKRVHEVLERLYTVTREGRVPSLARVIARFHAEWETHWDPERVQVVRDDAWPELYLEQGERCLTNYYRRHYPFDGDETLGVEERVSFALDGEGAYRIQGFVDRVVRARDGAIEIHDYKTSGRVPKQAALDRDRQLGLYQLGMAERYGADRPYRLVWHYLLHDQVRTSTRTPEQLDALRAKTIGLIDRIRAETAFEPKVGPLCRWCEYRPICPAQGAAAEPDAPEPPAVAVPAWRLRAPEPPPPRERPRAASARRPRRVAVAPGQLSLW